jgi:hypothetical protein
LAARRVVAARRRAVLALRGAVAFRPELRLAEALRFTRRAALRRRGAARFPDDVRARALPDGRRRAGAAFRLGAFLAIVFTSGGLARRFLGTGAAGFDG